MSVLFISGCADCDSAKITVAGNKTTIIKNKIINYYYIDCNSIWDFDEKAAYENSSYWLRAMECAQQLNDKQARELAQQLPEEGWAGNFKQNILLAATEPAINERRQLITDFSRYRANLPEEIIMLAHLWLRQQQLQLAIFEMKTHYQQRQAAADSQIETLRQNQKQLQQQLGQTERKLAELTDIERQLSSRKHKHSEITQESVNTDSGITETTKEHNKVHE